ncbi:MAG TPA: lysylphosphatidylglycerol synthase domain-containing protein [Pyrinomonadaceae bacterium]|nr:lysylphosphatidylglycerol synthase domain-containing protein [Pyrinomonadaceae bacterium]
MKENAKRSFTPVGLLLTAAGIVLFVYFVNRAGLGEIYGGIKRLGTGFLLVIAISGARHIVRSAAWCLCMEPPHRLKFSDALRARLMGDAIGNILPIGSFALAEPSKPILIRDRVPLMAGFSSFVIENVFYALSVVIFVFAGMMALLLTFHLPKGLRIATVITIAVIAVLVVITMVLVRRQVRFVSRAAAFGHRRGFDGKWIDKSRMFEDRVYGFYSRNARRFLPILLLESSFHLAGVLEIYVTLYFISPEQAPTLFTAFILESVNRIITMAFKFIPLRMGVDEAGTAKVSKVLRFTEASGVTLAIVRKGRDLFWAVIGIALLVHRGFSLRAIASETDVLNASSLESHLIESSQT